VWMSWAAVLSVAAGFGWYGFGWLLREMQIETVVGEPFGGLYWLMTVVLPGYASFRYPAKLLVVASLGLSVLASWGWDDAFSGKSRVGRWFPWLGGLSLLGLIASLAVRPWFGGWLADVKPDMLFGPLDVAGAANDMSFAFAQTAVLCGLFYLLIRKASGANDSRLQRFQAAALLLVAIDLAVANGWMVACSPAGQWHEKSAVAEAIAKQHARRHGESAMPARVYRHPLWMRPSWREAGSADRMKESMQWDHATLWPKYNLADRISVLDVQGAMKPRKKGSELFSASSLAEYVILPGDKRLRGAERVPVDVPDVSLWIPKIGPQLVFLDEGKGGRGLSRWELLRHDPSRVEVEVELARPGTIVLSEQFYPGWRLWVKSDDKQPREVPIIETGGSLRGAKLPAGRHKLVYSYRPTSVYLGAIISGIAWLLVLVMSAIWIRDVLCKRTVG